jgi:hypothetical protein
LEQTVICFIKPGPSFWFKKGGSIGFKWTLSPVNKPFLTLSAGGNTGSEQWAAITPAANPTGSPSRELCGSGHCQAFV